ncbi:MAG: ATP-binding protein, partial [Deltaproteobacteria bacterium]
LISTSSQYGANTLQVTRAVEAALADLKPSLDAEGVTMNAGLHRPANFIQAALGGIAEDLLTYARIPALHLVPTDVSALVADTVAKLNTTGEIRQCDVRLEIAPATIDIDPLRMRQVLTNLLRNGAQAMGGAGRIDVVGRDLGESYELTVGDEGPGIAPEMRASLFEPFATNRSGGTGLGLAVCDGIVRTHGGEITVADRTSGGSLFTLRLPGHAAQAEGRT